MGRIRSHMIWKAKTSSLVEVFFGRGEIFFWAKNTNASLVLSYDHIAVTRIQIDRSLKTPPFFSN